MKKFYVLICLSVLAISNVARADEGMWLPFLLGRNYDDMKAHGLRLTQEQVYSLNNGSLKDAVVSFGGFCTGEIISKSSLILTNHHCGYNAIAENSTKEKNYLDNGFWAKNNAEEIPIKGLTATFMIRIEDVSATVLKELNDGMTPAERNTAIQKAYKILADDAKRGTHYEAFVRDFFGGNEFYLFVQEKFTDIRLVGTPPQSAGKYGGDTDNWMWPRHTADFSMFRVYAGSDNKPAAYSAENKPFTPRHSLPISLKGVQKDDYAMIMGFPGRTDRFLTSYGVDQASEISQPKFVEIRKMKLDLMKKYMDKDVTTRLNYSGDYAQVANYWKYFIGQSSQLKNNKVGEKKRAIEADFAKFAAGKDQYKNVLGDIEKSFVTIKDYLIIKAYMREFIGSTDLNVFALTTHAYVEALEKDDKLTAGNILVALKSTSETFFKNNNFDIEFETFEAGLKMYLKDVPVSQRNEFLNGLGLMSEAKMGKMLKKLRKKSIFFNQQKYEKWLISEKQTSITKDPLFKIIRQLYTNYISVAERPDLVAAEAKLTVSNRQFIKGLREMNATKNYFPNANSTLRLTYGNVLPYTSNEGKQYDFTTDFEGVLAKEDQSNPEFALDAKSKAMGLAKDFGRYADKKTGKMIVNFIANTDITGGNSGSPVINGDGQLIGAAFDGNWEAMSGDIYFEPNLQRTIVCDIRYILWLVDKVGGASNLINEMELIEK